MENQFNFKDVIANIKPGQVWVGEEDCIRVFCSPTTEEITIDFEQDGSYCISNLPIFKLEKVAYSFNDAFEMYEQGFEIQNYIGERFRRIYDEDCMWSVEEDMWIVCTPVFTPRQIRQPWYIKTDDPEEDL